MKRIKINYINKTISKIKKVKQGDWIDLRASIDIKLHKNNYTLIPLGVSMQLPKGYEAHLVPRSSTFKNYGIIQTNGIGIIDESYCGDNDQWFMPIYTTRDCEIHKNDRICQFRIVKKMPSVKFKEVDFMKNKNRGGHGSTGIK